MYKLSEDVQIVAEGNSIKIKDATEVLIFISSVTDFKNPSFETVTENTLNKAIKKILRGAKKTAYNQLPKII